VGSDWRVVESRKRNRPVILAELSLGLQRRGCQELKVVVHGKSRF
jgi:hypothetical protein